MLVLLLILSAVSATLDECYTIVQSDMQEAYKLANGESGDFTFLQRILATGKNLNDLGSYSSCLELQGSSYYLVKLTQNGYTGAIGLCIPSKCTEEDLNQILSSNLEAGGSATNLETVDIQITQPWSTSLDLSGWLMVLFTGFLIVFSILAGYLDSSYSEILQKQANGSKSVQFLEGNKFEVISEEEPLMNIPPWFLKYIKAFSISRNYESLFTIPGKGMTTEILNGVRAFSFSWVILAHIYGIRAKNYVINYEDYPIVLGKFSTAFAYGAASSVDTFFWLSAFLLSYLMLKFMQKRDGKMPWLFVIFNRYLRILPVYLFTYLFSSLVIPALGSGPQWEKAKEPLDPCSDYWWTNFLYVNNFVPDGAGNNCMGWTWYLAVDMQFFLMSPILFIAYHRFDKKTVWYWCGALLGINLVINFALASSWSLKIAFTSGISNDFFYYFYVKPYVRYSPYLIGLLCGFVYYNYINEITDDPISNSIISTLKETKNAWISFLSGFSIITFTVFIQMIPYNDSENDYKGFSDFGNEFFVATRFLIYTIGLCMVLMPMLLGELSSIAKVLTAKAWVPLAKVSFCCYMIHSAIIGGFFMSEEVGYYITPTNLFIDFVFGMVVSFSGALVMYLVVEMPFSNLITLMLGRE